MDAITKTIESLLWGPRLDNLPVAADKGVQLLRFLYAVLRDIIAGNLTLRAMGLVYITILSIVPVIAISFSILKGFGFHRQLEPLLLSFLEPLGEKGKELGGQVMGFVENVQGDVLAGVGLIMLFVTTISMAQKVEDSFNYVWRVDRPRGLAQRLSEYLSLILIVPIVMVTALALIAAVKSNTLVQEIAGIEPIGETLLLVGKLAPYVLVVLGFTMIYWFLPNTRVRFFAALIGGLAGGLLWAGTGFLFATFVATSARTLSIYATFAIVILALIWIYLCWLTLLIGALVSYYAQNPEHLRLGYRTVSMGNRQKELIAFSLMIAAAKAFHSGAGQPTLTDVAGVLRLPELLLAPVANRLVAAGLLSRTGKDQLFPQRDPNGIYLQQVINAVRDPQSTDVFPEGQWPELVTNVGGQVDAALNKALADQSIYDLLDTEKSVVHHETGAE
jgi:membrane protein